jgi:hypothetical protein
MIFFYMESKQAELRVDTRMGLRVGDGRNIREKLVGGYKIPVRQEENIQESYCMTRWP